MALLSSKQMSKDLAGSNPVNRARILPVAQWKDSTNLLQSFLERIEEVWGRGFESLSGGTLNQKEVTWKPSS